MPGQFWNSATLLRGGVSAEVGCWVIVHWALPDDTAGVGSTTNVHPCGAAVDCTARTVAVASTRPYVVPWYTDSAHIRYEYSMPSSTTKLAFAPSADTTQRCPSRTMPNTRLEPSPLSAAVAAAVTVAVASPFEVESSASTGPVGAPMPLALMVRDAPEVVPARPGGTANREYGVTVTGEAVFEPTR